MLPTLAALISLVPQDAPLSARVSDGDVALKVAFERAPAAVGETFGVRLVESEGDWFEIRATRSGVRTRIAALVAVGGVPREVDYVELPAELGFTLALERIDDRFLCALGGLGSAVLQPALQAVHPMVVNDVRVAAPGASIAWAELPWGEFTPPPPRPRPSQPVVQAAVPAMPEVLRVEVGALVEELLAETESVRPVEETVAVAPVAGESVASEPVAAPEVVAIEPVAIEPVAIEPVANEPVANEPVATEPVATEPVVTEPVALEPVGNEPATTEPVAIEPVVNEPVATEPVASEPVDGEPSADDAVATAPVVLEPDQVSAPAGDETAPPEVPASEPDAAIAPGPAASVEDGPAAWPATPVTSFGVSRLAEPFHFHAPSTRCTYRVDEAGKLTLTVPGGVEHQCFDGLGAPAVLAPVPADSFTFSARFDSDVRGGLDRGGVRLQGLVVELAGGAFLRCELVGDGARVFVAASRVDGATVTPLAVERVRSEAPWTLAVTRTGEGVSFSLSDGIKTTREVARAVLTGPDATPRRVGVYAGNALGPASPAHTAVIGDVSLR